MTEKEAKLILDVRISRFDHAGDVNEALEMAKQALEEIQQYRAIGTVEELSRASRYIMLAKKHGTIGQMIDECVAYEEIGTVEECREAVEKQKPKDVVKFSEIIETIFREIERTALFCPECGSYICEEKDDMPKHCNNCGQAINRSNEN